mgnify:CR=1 FL=1
MRVIYEAPYLRFERDGILKSEWSLLDRLQALLLYILVDRVLANRMHLVIGHTPVVCMNNPRGGLEVLIFTTFIPAIRRPSRVDQTNINLYHRVHRNQQQQHHQQTWCSNETIFNVRISFYLKGPKIDLKTSLNSDSLCKLNICSYKIYIFIRDFNIQNKIKNWTIIFPVEVYVGNTVAVAT